jgi:hypothetical protein
MDFSSLERPGGGVAVEVRVGERAAERAVEGFRDGVAGRLAGRWARLPSSARRSCSDWELAVGLEVREVVVLGRGCALAPRSSSWARRSSGWAVFLAAMVACCIQSRGGHFATAQYAAAHVGQSKSWLCREDMLMRVTDREWWVRAHAMSVTLACPILG